ncbi:MAG: flagellar basal body-associated FliL family protein, partial [Syntrophales bacterium]|nr:flagellar basal body-associated FliL family protein [Syntrophales bacterium]
GGWLFYQHRSDNRQQAVVDVTPQIGTLWSMGTLIVNLLDDEGERYLKATIELELSSPDMVSELDVLKPKILDGILDLLSSKYYRDIVGFEGKQHLRDEISLRINNYLSRGRISNVYFTDFVIQ